MTNRRDGERSPGTRSMREEWATAIRDICQRDRVEFFFKQWGGARLKSGGHARVERVFM